MTTAAQFTDRLQYTDCVIVHDMKTFTNEIEKRDAEVRAHTRDRFVAILEVVAAQHEADLATQKDVLRRAAIRLQLGDTRDLITALKTKFATE